MPTPNSQHIVIVGAGPGGLAASLLLAKAGVNVTVVERSSKVGGRTKIISLMNLIVCALQFRLDIQAKLSVMEI